MISDASPATGDSSTPELVIDILGRQSGILSDERSTSSNDKGQFVARRFQRTGPGGWPILRSHGTCRDSEQSQQPVHGRVRRLG